MRDNAKIIRRRRRGGTLAVLSALLAVMAALVCMFAATPAPAQAAEAVDICNPTAQNGCINGILQDSNKTPIGGVTITLSGEESATTTTGDDGTWAFSVEADGDYTVTLDQSVVSQYGLKSDHQSVEIEKASFDKQRSVVRFDQPATDAATGSSADADGGSGSADSAGSASGSGGAWSGFAKRFWQQLYSGIIFGLMLGLMSVGMNLVYGTTGLSSFSHGEQVTLGGLMCFVGTQMMHLPIWLSVVFAVAVGALTGLLQNEILWRPLRRKHVGTMQQMIVTIGLSMAMQYVFQFFFGGDIKGITKSVPDTFDVGPITTDIPTLLSAAVAIIVIVGMTLFLYRTRLGRATRAVSDNSALAAVSGINVEQVVRIVWILSCALAALSGCLMGIYLNGISWNTGATLLLLMFAAVTLGGLGTANGALIGSLVIGIVADMSTLVIPDDMRYASALAILIIVLLARPQGIFGKQQRVG